MITIETEIINNIPLVNKGMRYGALRAASDILEKVKVTASENLQRTSVGMGADNPSKSINNNWEIISPKLEGSMIIGSLKNNSPHASHVEYGTGARGEFMATDMIRPKGSKPLRFKVGGRWVSKWEVQGQYPKAYLRNAIFELERTMSTIIIQSIQSEMMF